MDVPSNNNLKGIGRKPGAPQSDAATGSRDEGKNPVVLQRVPRPAMYTNYVVLGLPKFGEREKVELGEVL